MKLMVLHHALDGVDGATRARMLGESALRFQVDGQASQEYTSSHVASMHLTLDAAATV